MPTPLSATRIATKSPRSPSSTALPFSMTGVAVMVSVPPFGMASRALTARLSIASSNSPGSTLMAQLPLETVTEVSMSPRSDGPSISFSSGSRSLRSTATGDRVCRRENASS